MKNRIVTMVLLITVLTQPAMARRHALHKRPLNHKPKLSLMDVDWPAKCQAGLTAKDRALFVSLIKLDKDLESFNYEVEEFCES